MRMLGCAMLLAALAVWALGIFILIASFMAFVRMSGSGELIEVVRHGLGSIILFGFGMLFSVAAILGFRSAIGVAKRGDAQAQG